MNNLVKLHKFNFFQILLAICSINAYANDPVPIGRPGLMENCKYAYTSLEYLTPPDPVCTFNSGSFNTQVANGCQRGAGDVVGQKFSQSVMGVYFPREINPNTQEPELWMRSCTATVIDRNKLITAAHCIAGADPKTGDFYPEERVIPLYVVPGQQLSSSQFGLPAKLDKSTVDVEKYEVSKITIAHDYNYFGQKWPEPYPEHDYVKADWAILELKEPLPSKYKIIDLATHLPTSGSQIWFAGYGVVQGNNIERGGYQYQRSNNDLNYRNMYYIRSDFPFQDGSYFGKNLNEIYTLGSLPVNAGPDNLPSAWKFTGAGDSGGPFFLEDQYTHKLSLIGTLTGGTDCTWAGFMAPLPYSYTHGPSMLSYRELIQKITRNQADAAEIRQVSPRKKLYVIDQNKVNLYTYSLDVITSNLAKPVITSLKQVFFPIQIAGTSKDIFVISPSDNAVLSFKKDEQGDVLSTSGVVQKLLMQPVDIKSFDENLFLIGSDADGGWLYIDKMSDRNSLENLAKSKIINYPTSVAVTKLSDTANIIFIASDSPINSYNDSITILKFDPATKALNIIKSAFKLDNLGGNIIKILADKNNHLFVLREKGIEIYKVIGEGTGLELLGLEVNYFSSDDDMLLLPDGRLVVSGSQLAQYELNFIYDITVTFKKSIIDAHPYKGLAYEYEPDRVFLYAANDINYTARTLSVFSSYKGKSFTFNNFYKTGEKPTQMLIR